MNITNDTLRSQIITYQLAYNFLQIACGSELFQNIHQVAAATGHDERNGNKWFTKILVRSLIW